MDSKQYRLLTDAILDYEDEEIEGTIDFVLLPPENVDSLTDTEENYGSNFDEIDDISLCPETCGNIEVFTECMINQKENLEIIWRNDASNSILQENSLIYETSSLNSQSQCKENFSSITEKNLSSYGVFLELFDENLFTYIVKQSNIYAHQSNNHDFHMTVNDLKSFIGILILSGYHRLPRQHMYWESASDSGVELVKTSMPYKNFKLIKKFLHFNDNSKVDVTDKVFKLRPIIRALNNNFIKFGIFEKNISIDEQMVPYTGRHSIKMFMKNKPVRFGFKNWVAASSSGYVYNFKIYAGKSETYNHEFGLGASVVIGFVDELKFDSKVNLYFDNFFTSYKLLNELKTQEINATGTVRQNRIKNCPVMLPKVMRKKPRGEFEIFKDSNGIYYTQWNDTKTVTAMSNCFSVYPLQSVRRYLKSERKYVSINQPFMISMYNKFMGGVDLADNSVACYRINIKGKKWYWPLFTNMVSLAVVNSWRIYNIINNSNIDLLEHTRNIVSSLITATNQTKYGRKSQLSKIHCKNLCSRPVIVSDPEKRRRRCFECKSTTVYVCKGCDKHLHIKCSDKFYSK